MSDWQTIADILEAGRNCVLLTVTNVKGSAPREIGACMVIAQNGNQTGTIGGGALEWQASKQAKKILAENDGYLRQELELILGPDLEQCCGGVVAVSYELFTAAEKNQVRANATRHEATDKQNLVLFGAGHIGKALTKNLADHDFTIQWIDSRENIFPADVPENVQAINSAQPVQMLTNQPPNTFVLIMTHNHTIDFDIACAALQYPDICFTGLIGSATKKARFVKRFAEQGLTLDQISRLICPIGIKGITSKTPSAIAASVTAQLLIETELVKTGKNNVLLRKNSA